jgi:hypothetical protein
MGSYKRSAQRLRRVCNDGRLQCVHNGFMIHNRGASAVRRMISGRRVGRMKEQMLQIKIALVLSMILS